MSVNRNIDIDFSIQFSEDHIRSILNKALCAGCHLYQIDPKTHNELTYSLDKMTLLAYKGYNTPRVGGGFLVRLHSIKFIISFFQNLEGTASLALMLMKDYWVKKFIINTEEEEKIDYARYIKFMLKISKSLPIKSIKIYYE